MDDGRKIKFLSEEFQTNLSLLKQEVDKMNNLFNEVESRTKQVDSYWRGQSSENNIQSFRNFSSQFSSIHQHNLEYTKFLESVNQSYQLMEANIIKAMDEGSGGLSINGSDQ